MNASMANVGDNIFWCHDCRRSKSEYASVALWIFSPIYTVDTNLSHVLSFDEKFSLQDEDENNQVMFPWFIIKFSRLELRQMQSTNH